MAANSARKGARRGGQAEKPVLPPTLVSGVQSSMPASGKSKDTALTNAYESYFNKSIKDVRSQPDTLSAARLLARVHGDTSAAVSAMVRLANTKLRVFAYDANHQLSDQGTALARSILTKFDNLSDYSYGFDDRQALAGVIESLLREVAITSANALELVLDENRLPFRLQPVPCHTLKWRTAKKDVGKGTPKSVPYQTVSGEETILDIPTFFYASMDQDPAYAYPASPLEPAVNTAPFHGEVIEDIRRVVYRSGHSRLCVKMNVEALKAAAPPDVRTDPAKMAAWMESVRRDVEAKLANLSPETALVYFDSISADYLNSEIGASADYSPLMETLDGILSTALKTPPSILGKRIGGSQNTSSTESLLFLKTAAGIQPPVATVLSRAMTLAVRLFGFPGYVTCSFDPIDLRPDIELQAFRSMIQTAVLEQLSLGFLTDQEAAEALGTGPRAQGAPKLSGTFFYRPNASANANGDTLNNVDPARRALTTDAPSKAGGRSQ